MKMATSILINLWSLCYWIFWVIKSVMLAFKGIWVLTKLLTEAMVTIYDYSVGWVLRMSIYLVESCISTGFTRKRINSTAHVPHQRN